ncbi:hypothetical protein [Nocardioides sp. TF02-7]|uniref:hypothetical protein n=1 Tax=Nocardioides sp. TF02-7 TaxID=2917724 RepID=UPI001F057A36|nr:hypothetical protein [Nocardioides sp. TF02-7]UMG94517.1 hypothetical protein MF408_11430 [Nocardioides sp. TF02-7]
MQARRCAAALVIVLVGTLAAVTPAAADDPRPLSVGGLPHAPAADRAGASDIVAARVGRLRNRPSGFPTGAPARTLASAEVRQDLLAERVSGRFVLAAAPTAATAAHLTVGFGHADGSTCQGDVQLTTPTLDPAPGWARAGRTITLDQASEDAGWQDWDCAFAVVAGPGQTPEYDARVDRLTDVPLRPALRLGAVRLLGSTKVRLVPGVWTTVEVVVRNTSRADAAGVVVTGAGKGVQVRRTRVGKVWGESSTTERVSIRLRGRRAARVRLTVKAPHTRASRTVRVRPAAAPARPRAGVYVSTDGSIRFRIRNGRVVGFSARLYTRCGGYPDLPTYSWSYYDFPTVAIPRNGIVDRIDDGRLYDAGLRMRVSGGSVTKGGVLVLRAQPVLREGDLHRPAPLTACPPSACPPSACPPPACPPVRGSGWMAG